MASLKLKLIVDSKKKNKIFVDFLFKLLKLPMGSVVHLLANRDMDMEGCLANLYNSVTTSNYLIDHDHSISFITSFSAPFGTDSFLLQRHEVVESKKKFALYQCDYEECGRLIYKHSTDLYIQRGVYRCAFCLLSRRSSVLTRVPTEKFEDENSYHLKANLTMKNGYVKDAMYMVTDDLKVIQYTVLCCKSLLRDLNVSDTSVLDEKIVDIPMEKILALMKASLQSSTVLTDVFLRKQTTVKTEPQNK